MCVNNLPNVVTRQCPSAESNLRLWVTSGLQVRHVTVRLPSHTTITVIIQVSEYEYEYVNTERSDLTRDFRDICNTLVIVVTK